MLRKDERKTFKLARDRATGTSDAAEVARFNATAEEWWRPDGKFKVVHAFNACRVAFLVDHLARHLGPTDAAPDTPLKGLKIADIGCGGGLVSEPLARGGAHVFAIDAAERNIALARHHAIEAGVDITYQHALPEDLAADDHYGQYDAVLSLEVVEHVADLNAFLSSIAPLVKPGGLMVIGTLNRTAKSFAFGIVGAEYILGLLPRGTHDWRKFVQPFELDAGLKAAGLKPLSLDGVSMNPITWSWSISSDSQVNYLRSYQKVE